MTRPSIVMSGCRTGSVFSVVPVAKFRAGVEIASRSAMSLSVTRSSSAAMFSACATMWASRIPEVTPGPEHPGGRNQGGRRSRPSRHLRDRLHDFEGRVLDDTPDHLGPHRRVVARRLRSMLSRQQTLGEQCEWRDAKTHLRANQYVLELNSTFRQRVCELSGNQWRPVLGRLMPRCAADRRLSVAQYDPSRRGAAGGGNWRRGPACRRLAICHAARDTVGRARTALSNADPCRRGGRPRRCEDTAQLIVADRGRTPINPWFEG